jgi:curved DNA-binding protein CbpA
MSEAGYVNYYEILGVPAGANPGEVRKTYRREMKRLLVEISRSQMTSERRTHFLLEMAKLNAASFILRDKDRREQYWTVRQELIDLEEKWRQVRDDLEQSERYRKQFDGKVRHFLSKYVEESMLEAGRDPECVEASHWDPAHERHATRILRHYRHRLHQDILERLPYFEVTPPSIDWTERERRVAALLGEGAR